MDGCPFCERLAGGTGLIARTRTSAAFADGHPVSDGHALVIPVRHVGSVLELEPDEWADLWALVRGIAAPLARDADGVNLGTNAGAAAGQTLGHAHVHVIPRRAGDVEDPRGGVRWVIPERARYWS